MSYYVDPWLFNCVDNPADSPADQAEQRTIITAMQRALDYAHRHGVTLVSAAGNGATDYTKTLVDGSSPDFASEPGRGRLPADDPDVVHLDAVRGQPRDLGEQHRHLEAQGVLLGLRQRLHRRVGAGRRRLRHARQHPRHHEGDPGRVPAAARRGGRPARIPTATPNVPNVVRDCRGGTCAYYQYLQGTSMASPHATGVAALAIGRWGLPDFRNGGKFQFPDVVELLMRRTATNTPCPTPRAFTYTRHLPTGATVTDTHTCEGGTSNNGFYGDGILNALKISRGF